MTIARFYHSRDLASHQEICLDEMAAYHAAKVLRLKEKDAVVLFDGKGGEYPARITGLAKNKVMVLTGEWQDIERESPLQIILAQAVSSSDKMDFTVQKAVELGATGIQPLVCQRGTVRMDAERAKKRVQHWQKVAIAACEQCGRNRIPQVGEIISLKKFLGQADTGMLRIMLSPKCNLSLKQLEHIGSRIIVLAGAEGGLTNEEEQAANTAGFTAVKLGRRILRTESAGLTALAALQMLWGDF